MKISSYDKWHCHIRWNLILAIFYLHIKDGTGFSDIELQTKMFTLNGELRVPVQNNSYNPLRDGISCPDDILELPLLNCQVLDTSYRSCWTSDGDDIVMDYDDEVDIALQFKYLDKGSFPSINTKKRRIISLRAEEGGFKNLNRSMLEKFSETQILSLSKHWLENILQIDVVFSHQKSLQELYLESNGIISWNVSDDVKDDVLPELKVLSLSGNPIEFIAEESLRWLKNSKLETLILRDCTSIMSIAAGMLLPVSDLLRHLDLSRSGMNIQLLKNLTVGLKSMANSSKLEGLGLAQMGLTKIPGDLLYYVNKSLKYLSLYGNRFNFQTLVTDDNFPRVRDFQASFPIMPHLEELDLRANSMNILPQDILKPLCNLKKLFLGSNEFSQINITLFEPVKKLTLLSLRSNNIGKPELPLRFSKNVFSHLTELEYLDLSFTAQQQLTNMTFKGLHSLQTLLLAFTDLRSIEDGVFADLKNLRYLDISDNNLAENVNPNAFAGLTGLYELYARRCGLSLKNVRFEYLNSIITLDLTSNNVEHLGMFINSNMPKLNILILTGNKIVAWHHQLFKNSSVHALIVNQNLLNEITPAMSNDFNNIEFVEASENPYQCYCSMKDFSLLNLCDWSELYTCQAKDSTLIPLQNISLGNCIPKDIILKHDNNENNMQQTRKMIVISVTCAVILTTALTAFCYWKRWHIQTCARMLHKSAWFSIMSNENDVEGRNREEQYFYDVFVSYSDPDRRWIMDHLLPNLEADCHVKVCLHERDFKAGLSILENIMACMEQSRCILMVLSKSFLRSHWCQFELNMAQHRLLEMKRDHLLLVLLEPVPKDHCTKMMRYLMLTKTYLQWPSNDKGTNQQEQQLFWKRLRKAVGCPQDVTISRA